MRAVEVARRANLKGETLIVTDQLAKISWVMKDSREPKLIGKGHGR